MHASLPPVCNKARIHLTAKHNYVTSTRPSRLDLDQLLVVVVIITAPIPPHLNSIIIIVQRTPLLRLSRTRSTPEPRIVLAITTKLELFVRRILITAEGTAEAALATAQMQSSFTQLDFRRRSERVEFVWLLRQRMSDLDG